MHLKKNSWTEYNEQSFYFIYLFYYFHMWEWNPQLTINSQNVKKYIVLMVFSPFVSGWNDI